MIGQRETAWCSHAGSILGHPVEYVRENPPKGFLKFRERWYAVDLNCAVLREHLTTTDGDGEEIQIYREAVSVKPGEPPADYFDIPPDYQERGPAGVNNNMGPDFLGEASARNKKPQTSYNSFMRPTS